MIRVKGPNGLVLGLPDHIAEGLLASPSGDYVRVVDEPKASKKAAVKPSPKK